MGVYIAHVVSDGNDFAARLPVELGSKPLWSLINIGTAGWFWMLDRRATFR